MPVDNRTLHKAQDAPSPAQKKFAGRDVLVNGLFEGSRGKTEDEILASRYILETVMQLVDARDKLGRYEALIIGEASSIVGSRSESRPPADAPAVVQERPSTEEDALSAAVKRIGLEGRITRKRSAPSGNFIIGIEIEGKECHVMLPKDTMQKPDPVGYVEELARKQGLRTKTEQREEMLERRRSARPPSIDTEALGIGKGELEKRAVTYEGELKGEHHFTYLPEEIGSTFCVSSAHQGRSMLPEIDRKIFSLHIQFRKPFVASILEQSMASAKATPGIECMPEGSVKAVAKALHILANGSEIEEELVPPAYLDAFRRIKESKRYDEYHFLCSRGALTKDEAATFMQAFEKVAHPTDGMVRSWAGLRIEDAGELSEADLQNLHSMLRSSEKNPQGVCERALRYLADSYSALTGDRSVIELDLEGLEARYLEMTVRIRKAIVETIPEDMRKLVD